MLQCHISGFQCGTNGLFNMGCYERTSTKVQSANTERTIKVEREKLEQDML